MTKAQEKKILNFIKDNDLRFDDDGSELNSHCVIISGYALHIGVKDWDELYDYITSNTSTYSWNFDEELERVFTYARYNNYKNYWKTEEAKKQYKF